ncbi:MAG TPA: branched-chain amino acid ABC transporter permease, partial [Acetomicrobium flavidum]|nr:branched-chain amino acid ABC transporter permease [Acetomicrobium flavidum]
MGRSRRDRCLWYVMLIVLALLPLIPGPLQGPFAQHVLVSILLFACMSQAWNILGGYCGQVSFGHSVFFGIGAYGTGMAVVTYGLAPWP